MYDAESFEPERSSSRDDLETKTKVTRWSEVDACHV